MHCPKCGTPMNRHAEKPLKTAAEETEVIASIHYCPACGKVGLEIIDRSARPYAEWYVLTCWSCGLSETLNIPLGPAVPSLD